ncbi:tRNA (N(6)-L-threonylcarbamoyladenosine(37)-C(2))-methylthiotransferase MtaB [Blattabacterium cuenoti]|uniref:tRNA (N(6)-L-threonylcarbamoyladenosine(37)-C(2))- methylthiotransferase MtaB n=1 Tax=Blattabacterium cuenoti TaxID=1653831 RepID=UPI0021CFB120|nr:tRNA (N(6)-L-threonylcarbamoyladenosine(37)-C(2))-methylthiotransferase MtaB [Blattabacterium cuenoti]
MNIAFHTMGCKLNYAETSTIERSFSKKNYKNVSFKDYADVYIINSCCVTENAENEFKYIVRSVKRRNPQSIVIAMGCYAQYNPKKVSSIYGVDRVLNNDDKFNIVDIISDINVEVKNKKDKKLFYSSFSFGKRTRSFLKIQDGCNYKCSYCIIPFSRGKSISDRIENISKNINFLLKNGIKEIVLTGVNIGDYRGTNNKGKIYNFFELIQYIEQYIIENINIENIRIRLSSIEPNLLKDELIEFLSKSKYFVPHFHIPLQSGNNFLLGKMQRRYQRELYENKINKIRNLIPNAYIGSDVIVGFPGETYNHFLDTYFFLKKLDISYMHIFTYSSRPNTKSINFLEQIPNNIKRKRNKILKILSNKKYYSFCKEQIKTKKTVLFEKQSKNKPFLYGYTENYIRTKIFDPYLKYENSMQNVILLEIDKNGVILVESFH